MMAMASAANKAFGLVLGKRGLIAYSLWYWRHKMKHIGKAFLGSMNEEQ